MRWLKKVGRQLKRKATSDAWGLLLKSRKEQAFVLFLKKNTTKNFVMWNERKLWNELAMAMTCDFYFAAEIPRYVELASSQWEPSPTFPHLWKWSEALNSQLPFNANGHCPLQMGALETRFTNVGDSIRRILVTGRYLWLHASARSDNIHTLRCKEQPPQVRKKKK